MKLIVGNLHTGRKDLRMDDPETFPAALGTRHG